MKEKSDLRAPELIQAYGAVLERAQQSPAIRDVSELPAPKEAIKEALLVALRASRGDRATVELLRTSYVSLSDFQPVGQPGLSMPSPRTREEIERLMPAMEIYARWQKVCAAEATSLLAELEAHGL